MTAIATRAYIPQFKLNWPRVGALSGSASLHFFVLALLLTPPIAIQLLRRVQPEAPIFVHVLSEPLPEIVKPEPPTPTPVHRESHPHVTPHVAAVEHSASPVNDIRTEVSVPTITQTTEVTSSSASEDVAPTALAYNTRTRVAYPRESLLRGEHGTVVLRVLVGTDGLPQTVEIETSSGSRQLDIAARDAVRHWSFRPGTRDGIAHSAWARVPIAFDLSTL